MNGLDRKTLTIDVDKTGGAFQMSISLTDERGVGGGYRLHGPKYIGTSSPVFSCTLTALERKKIREYLDQADALGLP